jgi:hypothetical protein
MCVSKVEPGAECVRKYDLEESVLVASWLCGVFAFDGVPLDGKYHARLSITTNSDGKRAMSAELVYNLSPVEERIQVVGRGEVRVQKFRYVTTGNMTSDFGYCSNCGKTVSNVRAHVLSTKLGECPNCRATISSECPGHHTWGECPVCQLSDAFADPAPTPTVGPSVMACKKAELDEAAGRS